MKNEQKDLLLKDICARLPYGIKAEIKYYDGVCKLQAIYTNGTTYATRDEGYPIETYFEDCKPFLFPMSHLTDEQCREIEFLAFSKRYGEIADIYNRNHIDYRGLLEMKLAIDATNLNIY